MALIYYKTLLVRVPALFELPCASHALCSLTLAVPKLHELVFGVMNHEPGLFKANPVHLASLDTSCLFYRSPIGSLFLPACTTRLNNSDAHGTMLTRIRYRRRLTKGLGIRTHAIVGRNGRVSLCFLRFGANNSATLKGVIACRMEGFCSFV